MMATVIDDIVVVLEHPVGSQLSRMNWQTFSITFSSGHLGGSGSRVMLSGTFTSPGMCQPA